MISAETLAGPRVGILSSTATFRPETTCQSIRRGSSSPEISEIVGARAETGAEHALIGNPGDLTSRSFHADLHAELHDIQNARPADSARETGIKAQTGFNWRRPLQKISKALILATQNPSLDVLRKRE